MLQVKDYTVLVNTVFVYTLFSFKLSIINFFYLLYNFLFRFIRNKLSNEVICMPVMAKTFGIHSKLSAKIITKFASYVAYTDIHTNRHTYIYMHTYSMHRK